MCACFLCALGNWNTYVTCNALVAWASIDCSFGTQLLINLADRAKLRKKIDGMFNGEKINLTEDRAVLHVALRAPRNKVCCTLYTAEHGITKALHMMSTCSGCQIILVCPPCACLAAQCMPHTGYVRTDWFISGYV